MTVNAFREAQQTRAGSLFDLLEKDLENYTRNRTGQIRCPFCLRHFTKAALYLDDIEQALSEEHIVPKSVGGKAITLACKKCNNDLGSEIDSHLGLRLHDEAIARGEVPVRAKMLVGDAAFNTDILWPIHPNETIQITGLARWSNPANIDRAVKRLLAGEDSFQLQLRQKSVGYRYRTALLKIAYLTLFDWLGYRFVFHPLAAPLRHQIQNPTFRSAALDWLIWSITPEDFPATPVVVVPYLSLLKSPTVLVLIRIEQKAPSYAAVLMPLPAAEFQQFYPEIREKRGLLKSGMQRLTLKYWVPVSKT